MPLDDDLVPERAVNPPRLFRVVADVGYGFPLLTHRVRSHRNYQRADDAARWIRNLEWPPGHHVFVGLFVTDCSWREIDPELIGPPSAAAAGEDADADR